MITAYSDNNKVYHQIYELCSPFSAVIYGIPNSGKTYFLQNLIRNIKHDFDEIIIYLGAKDTANSFLQLVNKEEKKPVMKILFSYDEKNVREYIKKLENNQISLMNAKKKPKNILLVADDIFSFPDFMKTSRSKPSIIEEIFANYRHLNLSVIITSQKLKQITPNLRDMSKYVFVNGIGQRDLNDMAEELENTYFNKKQIIKCYEKVRKRDDAKGHILFINRDEPEHKQFKYINRKNEMEILKPDE